MKFSQTFDNKPVVELGGEAKSPMGLLNGSLSVDLFSRFRFSSFLRSRKIRTRGIANQL